MNLHFRKKKKMPFLLWILAGIIGLCLVFFIYVRLVHPYEAEDPHRELAKLQEPGEVVGAGSHIVTGDLFTEGKGDTVQGENKEANTSEKEILHQEYEEQKMSQDEEAGQAGDSQEKAEDALVPVEEEFPHALFLVAEDGYVTAYRGDQTEVFEYTDLSVSVFPEFVQELLEGGLYMETFEDYYAFLESYTS